MKNLVKNLSEEEFIFGLLLAYGIPKATVTLLKKGRHNLSKKEDQIILKKKLFFQRAHDKDLHETIDGLQKDNQTMRHNPRFIIVTDYETILAVDTKTQEHLDILIKDIAKRYDFFLPWAGMEKHRHQGEHPADRKAAEKMAKLYDGIMAENDISDIQRMHNLNVFLSRLLFCFFAEDTGIFEESLFTDSVASHTRADGEDLDVYLTKLFTVLNMREAERANLPDHFCKFPYVNGGLFKETHWIPKFSAKSHRIIIECGDLDWSKINPDIFGSMLQSVAHKGQRASLGMHYTSVPNIMKVVEPLFLDNLKEEFEKNRHNKKRLQELLARMGRIKFFDPACGSGNFLIITYKELRRLEMEIIRELGSLSLSGIHLEQFYGIEIDDFAHTIAKLSLYLAEHQMNTEFLEKIGRAIPTLPLKESGHIVCDNATRIDWEKVCSKHDGDEIYIFGNPPYSGSRNQNQEQKEDMKSVLKTEYKSLDYIACWFALAGGYTRKEIKTFTNKGRLLDFSSGSELPLYGENFSSARVKFAFVTTNSVSQGEQVALLWPRVLRGDLEIFFAHQSFKWENNAKGNAGVTVAIIGVQNISNEPKRIYREGSYTEVKRISPYLTGGSFVQIKRRSAPLSIHTTL